MSSRLDGQRPSYGKYRRGTFFSITFPTMPTLDKKPLEVKLTQAQNHHDVLTMTFRQTGNQWFDDIPTGLPVKFTWTTAGISTDWVGYVSYVSKVVTSLRDRTMEVRCVGASFPLKERTTKTFVDKTIPEAVAELASSLGLEYYGDPHPRKFPQLMIAGHSYWEWIQEQAKRIGYAVYVEGVTLYFRDIDKLITQNSIAVPTLSIEDQSSRDGQNIYDRTLEYFKVYKGDFIEDGSALRANKHIGGVDPITQESFLGNASPNDFSKGLRQDTMETLFQEYRTDQVALSSKDAQEAARSAAQLGRFNLPAKVRGQGDYRFRPYATVRVAGTGPTSDGNWVIKEVEHIFDKYGKYMVEMTILTDGIGVSLNEEAGYQGGLGKDTVNISKILSNSGAITSSRATSSPVLNNPYQETSHKELGFHKSPSRWAAAG